MDTTEKKMAAAILRFEDSRVTGPDSLRVSRLPAADKGGKWEICGICDGIEPTVFNRLKALLDAGRREEAWEGCLQYVLDNTAAVRSGWVPTLILALNSSCATIFSIPGAGIPGRFCSAR